MSNSTLNSIVLNIVELFQPMTTHELFYIYKKTKGFENFNIKNRDIHGINSPSLIINLMNNMDLISIGDEYITKKGSYTYYNAIFNISRDKYNKLRIKIIHEIMNKYQNRMKSDYNEDIAINE